jgi:putative peptidoglycan lipid II flippase
LARAAGLVSLGTLTSRLLGLAREILFGALFGSTIVADAFVVAFRIPNLLRDLFAEGALSSAFVPTFTDHLRNRSRAEAFALASRLSTTVAVILAVLALLGVAVADELVLLISPGFEAVPGKLALASELTRIMLPFLLLVSMAAVAMGMLNSLDRFLVPALAPACFNAVAIAVGAGLWLAGLAPEVAVVGWAVGTLLGGAAQLLVQVPALWRQGFRLTPALDLRFRDPGMRRILTLMGPAVAGLAATEINIIVNTIFASHAPGAPAWLNYAFRLMYLPLGLFGVAVGTVATAALAKRAAANDVAGLRQTLAQSLRLQAFLTLPATVGLMVLAEPVIRLIYERGRFTAADTAATAAALLFYAIGLSAYSGIKVVAPAFYATNRSRVALYGSVSAVVANLACNAALFPLLGHRGLALGTSIAALVNFTVLAGTFQWHWGGLLQKSLWVGLSRMASAAVVMGAAAWGAAWGLSFWLGTAGLGARLVGALVPVLVGVAIYALVCRLLRVPELDELYAAVRRRRR